MLLPVPVRDRNVSSQRTCVGSSFKDLGISWTTSNAGILVNIDLAPGIRTSNGNRQNLGDHAC